MGVGLPLIIVMLGAMVMPLAVRGGLAGRLLSGHTRLTMDENPQKYDLFGLSGMVCQLDRKPFFGRRNIV